MAYGLQQYKYTASKTWLALTVIEYFVLVLDLVDIINTIPFSLLLVISIIEATLIIIAGVQLKSIFKTGRVNKAGKYTIAYGSVYVCILLFLILIVSTDPSIAYEEEENDQLFESFSNIIYAGVNLLYIYGLTKAFATEEEQIMSEINEK